MAKSADRLREYEELFEKSQQFDPARYKADFEKAYGEKTDYNKDLIEQQSKAIGELQAVAPELSQRYATSLIKDPTAQRALIAQARQTPITQYSTASNLLGQRGQRYADILSTALEGYQSQQSAAQTAAENAWRLYQDQLAQEEAARARAASAAQSMSLADLLGGMGGEAPVAQELDITVPDTPAQKALNWTDKALNWTDKAYATDWLGANLLEAPTTAGGAALKAVQLYNPLTYVKTGAAALGNLLGNRSRQDMSFWDKLLNRR